MLKLVADGELSLDDRATSYLGFPSAPLEDVTIRDLLTHASGLPWMPVFSPLLDTEEKMRAIYPSLAHPGAEPRLVQQSYAATPARALPRGTGRYSNTGYSVLGAIIDVVTRHPDFDGRQGYEAYTYWNVGLKGGIVTGPTMTSMCLNTSWREPTIANMATVYRTDGTTVFSMALDPNGGPGGWRGPSGGWAMTIGDLTRLMVGIETNRFVTPALKQEMLAADTRLDGFGATTRYGLGLFKDINFTPSIMASGNIDGFTARSTYWPQEEIGVAVMCNREEAPNMRILTNDIAELLLL